MFIGQPKKKKYLLVHSNWLNKFSMIGYICVGYEPMLANVKQEEALSFENKSLDELSSTSEWWVLTPRHLLCRSKGIWH
jgi:hypothetical protein